MYTIHFSASRAALDHLFDPMNSNHLSSPSHLEQERDLQRCRESLEQNRPGDFYRTLVNIHHRIFVDKNAIISRLQEGVLESEAAITKLTADFKVPREIVATGGSDAQDFSETMCRYEAATRTNDAVIRSLNYENRRSQA
jgi:hypothetical protein